MQLDPSDVELDTGSPARSRQRLWPMWCGIRSFSLKKFVINQTPRSRHTSNLLCNLTTYICWYRQWQQCKIKTHIPTCLFHDPLPNCDHCILQHVCLRSPTRKCARIDRILLEMRSFRASKVCHSQAFSEQRERLEAIEVNVCRRPKCCHHVSLIRT